MNIATSVPPCACVQPEESEFGVAVYDPFCTNDVTHQVLGTAVEYPDREGV